MRVTVTPEQIHSAFEAVKDDPSFDESRGLWERGRPPVQMIQAMCLRPELLRAFAGFGNSVYPGGILERRVKELVIITASASNECQFCTFSPCDLVDIADIVAEPLVVIEDPAALVPRERIAIEYTRAVMADSNHIPAPLAQQAIQNQQAEFASFEEARRRFEREYLTQLLKITEGNVTQAARLAKRNRTEFYKLLGRHQLDPKLFKSK